MAELIVWLLLISLRGYSGQGSPTSADPYRSLVSFGDVIPFSNNISFTHSVHYLEEDINHPGNFIVSHERALVYMTTDGQLTPLVGNEENYNAYHEGTGTDADFSVIKSFSQYNSTHIAVADFHNSCVRNVRRVDWSTTPFIGQCRRPHCSVRRTSYETVYAPSSSLLCEPAIVIHEHNYDVLYISDPKTRSVLMYSFAKQHVKFVVRQSQRLARPMMLSLTVDGSKLYVSHDYGIAEVNVQNGNVQPIIDKRLSSSHSRAIISGVMDFDEIFYSQAYGMVWLIPDQVLMIAADSPGRLLVIDLIQQKVQTLCLSDAGSFGYGSIEACQVYYPTFLSIINQTVYIGYGEHNGRIATLGITGVPRCQRPSESTSSGTRVSPFQESYSSEQLLHIECDSGLSLSEDYNNIKCTGLLSEWYPKPPVCLLAKLDSIEPVLGQKAGGTEVTLKGSFPPNSKVMLDLKKPEGRVLTLTGRRSVKVIRFTMPMHTLGWSEITVVFGNSSRNESRKFMYTKNPEVTRVHRRTTFISGGLNIEFFVMNFFSAYNYSIILGSYNQTIKNCSTVMLNKDSLNFIEDALEQLICPTGAFDWLQPIKIHLVPIRLIGDGRLVSGAGNFNLTVYADPVIHTLAEPQIHSSRDEAILLTGENLNLAAGIKDYNITLGEDDRMICNIDKLTTTTLSCVPMARQLQTYQMYQIKVYVGTKEFTPGYIDIVPATNDGNLLTILVSAAVCLGVLVLLSLVAVCGSLYRHVSPGQNLHASHVQNRRRTSDQQQLNGADGSICPSLRFKVSSMLMDQKYLIFSETKAPLGRGQFGQVYLGQLTPNNGTATKPVAVKTLKRTLESKLLEDFLKEATLLLGCHHVNILIPIGVVWPDGDSPKVVLPYMSRGDLKSLVTELKNDLKNGDLLHFAMQISRGMMYLSSRGIIHRDLAARNCLVNDSFYVKVADFGLSRDTYGKDYYKESGNNQYKPVKWMALESLVLGIYTTYSDVWSFGITMWELFSRGLTPYPALFNHEVISYIQKGHRLKRPAQINSDIFEWMGLCWRANPSERPTFNDLGSFLCSLFQHNAKNKDYEQVYTKEMPDDYMNASTRLKLSSSSTYSADNSAYADEKVLARKLN